MKTGIEPIKWEVTPTECLGFDKDGFLIYDGYLFSDGSIEINVWSETDPCNAGKLIAAFKIKLK